MEEADGVSADLAAAWALKRDLLRQVREREPGWQPQPGVYQTIEGQIRTVRAQAREAEERLSELMRKGIGPGPFACESISANVPGRSYRDQRDANKSGRR